MTEAWNDFGVPVETIRPEQYAAAGLVVVDKRPKLVSVDDIKAEEDTSALDALKAEAQGLGVSFTYDDEIYVVDRAEDWDLEVFEAAESGKFVTAVKTLLGEDQWKRFKSKKRKIQELTDIFGAAQKALGTKS